MVLPQPLPPQNPCVPSPCGPNSQCRSIGNLPSCSCLENFFGSPPNCRPECTINSECPSNLACIQTRCTDPCPGSCGINAQCNVINHIPTCTCLEAYTGDPFASCLPVPSSKTSVQTTALRKLYLFKLFVEPPQIERNPCNPSPCGVNTVCDNGACTCLPEYFGDPYTGCRPECVLNNDCAQDKACIRNKCSDPCPGTCGQNARCSVINHIPSCSCLDGYVGNAFTLCSKIEGITKNIFHIAKTSLFSS